MPNADKIGYFNKHYQHPMFLVYAKEVSVTQEIRDQAPSNHYLTFFLNSSSWIPTKIATVTCLVVRENTPDRGRITPRAVEWLLWTHVPVGLEQLTMQSHMAHGGSDHDAEINGPMEKGLRTMTGDHWTTRDANLMLNHHWVHKDFQHFLALLFAMDEINKDPSLLPNISLGFHVHEIYHNAERAMEGAFMGMSGGGQTIPNYSCGKQEKRLWLSLEEPRLPCPSPWRTSWGSTSPHRITYGPFDPILHDKVQFPSLYQVAPKFSSLPWGMVRLMVHFGWTWVGLVVSDDMKGERFLLDLTREMVRNSVCAAFTKKIPSGKFNFYTAQEIYSSVMATSAAVMAAYGDAEYLNLLRFVIKSFGLSKMVLISTFHWDFTLSMTYETNSYDFHGTLTLANHAKEILGFRDFLQTVKPAKYPEAIILKKFWESAFDCSFSLPEMNGRKCSENASLEMLPVHIFSLTMSALSYSVYNAVYAVAHGLQNLLLSNSNLKSLENGDCLVPHPWQLHEFLSKVQFDNPVGEPVFLDENHRSTAKFEILNFAISPNGTCALVKVGEMDPQAPPDQDVFINEAIIMWPGGFSQAPQSRCSRSCGPGFRKHAQQGEAVCCYFCVQCPEGEISNQTDAEQCVKCHEDQYSNMERDGCLHKAVTFLSHKEPLGLILVCMSLSFSLLTALVFGIFIKHRDTPNSPS
ncbi:vomeronasal type-2 receptor 26 [Ornithorhynchus anatinus]|uniref:vomeronasal type-2 receptor 26 n=1 Tax=Ornithorhynchus anatinus TaxID=9258 RepID=UPI0019D4156E|nr:vomeronasal type-2 receptor 26 [Ornithorhynchus anatinus]